MDIAFDPLEQQYYKREEDPTLWKSEKKQRGPLEKGWQKGEPIMCCYKCVKIEFKYTGLEIPSPFQTQLTDANRVPKESGEIHGHYVEESHVHFLASSSLHDGPYGRSSLLLVDCSGFFFLKTLSFTNRMG
jgi:hypothetical protein